MKIEEIHNQLKTLAPIDGVSIGNRNDKLTWTIHYSPSATQEQRDAAEAYLSGEDVCLTNCDPAAEAAAKREQKIQLLIAVGMSRENAELFISQSE